ncbi:hypothetical protein STEG23_022979, partial [Scotinomys teguina]
FQVSLEQNRISTGITYASLHRLENDREGPVSGVSGDSCLYFQVSTGDTNSLSMYVLLRWYAVAVHLYEQL